MSARPKLVVGLGNPGKEYEGTRHNIGFAALDRLAEKFDCSFRSKWRFSAKIAEAVAGDAGKVVLAKPQTYMNLSGTSVAPLMAKHEIETDRLIVVHDELDLNWTAVRIKPKGSAAGHNGMKSLIASLRTDEFTRVRLGIHPDHPVSDGAEFVLSPFRRAQMEELDELTSYAADAVCSIIAEGVEKAMARFNRRVPGLITEEE